MTAPTMSMPRSLRANRNPHPGIADAPRPKRSTEEVQTEKDAKTTAAKEKENNHQQGILKTAEVEAKMRREHKEKLKNASNPPKPVLEKVLRPRKISEPPATFDGISFVLDLFPYSSSC